jgi:hypothetical protein
MQGLREASRLIKRLYDRCETLEKEMGEEFPHFLC